ncbi:hypothetical protein B0O99DRAFT_510277 [Bisporella sp. PMI_857]|nr:hypothetical protein B0O99DRAFT_510277 [Bisporella sp. PMI_857]
MSESSTPNPSHRNTGLSLYANLLDPSATTVPGTISKGPILKATDVSEDSSTKKPQIDAATLRFQPTKRPLLAQKAKNKPGLSKPVISDSTSKFTLPKDGSPAPNPNLVRTGARSTLADWADSDVNEFYGTGEKRQRGGRKRRKKNKEEYIAAQNWDDIYDPSRPNSYEEYRHSDEKIREVTEWKDRLYAHRKARNAPSEGDSDEEEYRPLMSDQFAPPPNYSFAPPPMDPSIHEKSNLKDNNHSTSKSPILHPTQRELVPREASLAASISRAPVRYNLPPPPEEIPSSEAELEKALAAEPDGDSGDLAEPGNERTMDEPRSLRPGQKGFAQRLMSKYGWSKGKGLGADGTGIINALSVQVEKRKKKSDAEGGGYREPGGRGKIVGGRKNVPENSSDTGKFGAMSEVIVLRGIVDGMDLDEEVDGSGDGGLMQEIGDECAEKYGRVERVYIDKHGSGSAKVFVKFTSQLSALRAVNALEGRVFNGNTISALFYDLEVFEKGIYE